MTSNAHSLFSEQLKSYFNAESVHLFARGRVALYAALRAAGVGEGDEVVMSGYTCMMVPSAPLALGATPIYVDIDPNTFNATEQAVGSAVTSRCKAIIVQHTYGIPAEMEGWLDWARQQGIWIIEDCCHAFGSKINDRLCGAFGDASFFSGQWNKPFSTGLGGMLVCFSSDLAKRIDDLLERELLTPSIKRNGYLTFQQWLHQACVTPTTHGVITRLYRLAVRGGLAIGSSARLEFEGRLGDDYFMGMAKSQARLGVRAMERIERNLSARKRNSEIYRQRLAPLGFTPLNLPAGYDPVLLRYPLRVANKPDVLRLAMRQGIEIGSWFESPLHPSKERLEAFHYTWGQCPQSERAARETINLPTHENIDEAYIQKVFDFLAKNAIL